MTTDSSPSASSHRYYLRLALQAATQAPLRRTNFRVGAVLVLPDPSSLSAPPHILTAHTLELPGNTHAEQNVLAKACAHYGCSLATLGEHLPPGTTLYTTMEPCAARSVGNVPCVERIVGVRGKEGGCAVGRVVVGVKEPETFVGENRGRARLEAEGVEVVAVEGMEEEILEVATAGHVAEEER